MNRAPAEHDTQRDLERRALRNVSWLAAKLGYRDYLDRRSEKALVIAIGISLVLLIGALVANGISKSNDEERELARRRCEVAAYVDVLPQMEQLVKSRRQDLAPADQAALARGYASDEASNRCKTAAPAR